MDLLSKLLRQNIDGRDRGAVGTNQTKLTHASQLAVGAGTKTGLILDVYGANLTIGKAQFRKLYPLGLGFNVLQLAKKHPRNGVIFSD
jgi:hypothetical protein